MEAEPGRQRSRQKHRERALQQQEKQIREGEGTIGQDDHNESPPRSSKDKLPRSKPKKGKCALFEEDIIDGFAILSFKTLEDLEILAKKNACNKDRSKSEEDNNIKDTHSQDKDDNDKTKKKKLKKNSSHNHCTENCSGVISDSSSSNIAPADSVRSSSEIGGCGSSNHINEDHNSDNQSYNVHHHHHHHLHHHNHHHSTVPLEPPRSISRDRLSDASTHSGSGQGYVCDVESGDDKASESGSELYSGIPVGGILNHITSSNLLPAEALSAPTPPPSTSATPISLCNGIGGPASESPTAALHVLVVTTTATTTTTTRSTSKSGFSDSVTTSTSTAVSVASVQPPPSVIHPLPYLPGHQDSKLSQLSPGSFLSQSRSKRSLSPSSQEQVVNNNHSNYISASSSCARSLQYSKSHKSNHIPNNTKDLPSRYSPNVFGRSDSPQNHPHLIQPPAFNNLLPSRVQNGPHNLSHLSPDLLHPRPGNSLLLNSHSPGAGYPYPPVIRPEPLVNHHSSRTVGDTKSDHQLSSGLVSNNGVHSTATATSPITANAGNHHSQQPQHHRSSSSSLGKSNTHHHHHSHQQHSFGGGSRSRSPPGHSSKRPCKSPSGLLSSSAAAAVASSLSSATVPPLSDPYKRFSTPLPTKQQQPSGKSDNVKHSTAGSEKDYPEVKSKDSSVSSAGHQHGHHHHHHHHHHHSKEHRDKDKERERDKQRTPVSLSTSLPSTIFQSPNPAWSSTSGPILNPLLPLHQPSPLSSSSTLHPLVPHPSQSSVASLFPLPLPSAPPLLAAGAPSLSVGMFAAPIHPAPPSLSSAPPLPAHPAASSQFSAESLLRSQDFLHQDLNNRLLAHRDSSTIALPPSPFVRSETHQHQHQHLHNHMHQHTYGGLNAAPLVPPTPPLFDKLPKAFEAGIFRPSIVHSYSAAFSSLLPPGPSGASLASSLQGAFQPKSLVTPGQMLVSFREREKAVLPPVVPPLQKKQGKWCAVHVRVAWEIYHRQQKKLQRDHDGAPGSTSTSSSKSGQDTKPLEPLLRPPSHLFPGSAATTRPPESPLLASVARSLPDGISHPGSSFLSSAAHLGISSFPRPSPYPVPSLLNPLGFSGLGTSMFAPVHDKVPAGLPSGMSSSPHEWSRLHRAHSTFPSWPKLEVEKERERELRREEEKDRERRGSFSHPHAGMDDIRHKDLDYSRPKSRSRSRSPLRNGRLDHHNKSEVTPYDRRFEDKRSMSTTAASLQKLKDERRGDDVPALPLHLVEREKLERERLDKERFERDRMERDRLERERIEKDKLLQSAAVAEREKLLQAVEREKLFQTTGYLGLNPFGSALPTHPGLLDRRVGLMGSPGAPYPFLERAPVPTSMWSPFDKSAAEFAHRLEMERERERMAMMSRLSSVPSHLAVLEQERLKDQILREQQEREYELRRQYFDRLPAFNADRLRAVDPLAVGSYFPQTISPMFAQAGLAGLKSNSPHGISGAPPPLIPSAGSAVAGTVLPSRSHDNSPSSSSKLKGCSPADSTSDLKDKREDSSTDPDAHSR